MYNVELDQVLSEFKQVKSPDGKTYENYYINREGVIINCNRKTMRVQKPKVSSWGYYATGLRDRNGNRLHYEVHKLVAKTFIPNSKPTRKQVNHKDGNKLNNHVDNLEWCTQSENTQHAYDTELIKNVMKRFKVYKDEVFIGEFKKKKDLVDFISGETGLSKDYIRKFISGALLIKGNSELKRYKFVQLQTDL